MVRAVLGGSRSPPRCDSQSSIRPRRVESRWGEAIEFGEARGGECFGEAVDGPAVRGRHLVRKRFDSAFAGEEADDEPTAGAENTAEFGEDGRDLVRRQMNEGEPGEQARDGFVRRVHRADRTDLERNPGVGRAGMLDEFGDHVEALGRDTRLGEDVREMPRPAAEVEDGTLGEVTEDESGVLGIDGGGKAADLDVELVQVAVGRADGVINHDATVPTRNRAVGLLFVCAGRDRVRREARNRQARRRDPTMPIRPVRRIARTLLGTTFIATGVNGLMNPKPRAEAAAALADKGRDSLPDALAAKVPDDPGKMVQINAMVQVAGGLLLASGRAPRPAAFLLAATVVPGTVTEQDFWSESDPDRKAVKRAGFLKDLGLLGGLMIAAADTEGKPSLGWRGRRAAHKLMDRSPSLAEQVRDEGVVVLDAAKTRGSQLAEVAKERGPQLAELARARSEQLAELARERGPQIAEAARERGAHIAEVARDRGPEVADEARGRSSHLVEVAKERGAQLAEIARERGTQAAEVARERGSEAAEVARERGAEAAEVARKRGARAAEVARERGEEAKVPRQVRRRARSRTW